MDYLKQTKTTVVKLSFVTFFSVKNKTRNNVLHLKGKKKKLLTECKMRYFCIDSFVI